MDILKTFNLWKNYEFFDLKTREELSALDPVNDAEEINDRFYKELIYNEFGLCGKMEAGPNRMNIYTVGKNIIGYALYLMENYGKTVCERDGIVVGYDSRKNSKLFAIITARVLSGCGIKIFMYNRPSTSAEVSFAVRYLNTVGGVMITAEDKPAIYNGCKIYNEQGCQLEIEDSIKISDLVSQVNFYNEIDFAGKPDLINEIDILNNYISTILKSSKCNNQKIKSSLKIVYSPLHGTGYNPVMSALENDGFIYISLVDEQTSMKGDFSTIENPDPTNFKNLEKAIKIAEQKMADSVIATDSDAGKLGVAIRHNSNFVNLTGNQIGLLLADYILKNTNLDEIERPVVIKSILTTNLVSELAKDFQVRTLETMKGSKFIGNRITQFERARRQGLNVRNFNFMFGFEESNEFTINRTIREKDAVSASMLICEYASILKFERKTLLDRLNEIYNKYGYYYDFKESIVFEKSEAEEKIKEKMETLRLTVAPFYDTSKIIDYSKSVDARYDFGELPRADIIKFELESGSWVAVEACESESKLNIYYNVKTNSEREAKVIQQKLQLIIKTKLEL